MTRTTPLALLILALAAPALGAPPQREDLPLPASLALTEPDGGLRVDDAGRFVPGVDARRLFDYFLTVTGEEPAPAIRSRIRAEVRARLAPPAAREALAFLDLYLGYRDRARALPAPSSLEEGFARLVALRRDVFGEEVASEVFGDEEELGRATLRQRATPDRKAAARAVPESLPRAVQAVHDEALAPVVTAEAEKAMTPAERAALREATFGPEAAARLAAVDAEEAGFRARLDAYRAARRAVEADSVLDPAGKAEALEALVASRFRGPEAVRVRALDRIDGITPE